MRNLKQGLKVTKSVDICGELNLDEMIVNIEDLGDKSLKEILKIFDKEIVKIKVGLVEEISK